MSHVSFHSLGQPDLEIGGTERAHAAVVTSRIAASLLDLRSDHDDAPRRRVLSMLRPERVAGSHWERDPEALLGLGFGRRDTLQWRGRPVSGLELALNTALAVGSDPLRLLARLHGQCEIHAHVAPEDRAWLAGVVDEGADSGVLRHTRLGNYSTWRDLAAWLRGGASHVVTSYSVCRSFPDSDLVVDVPHTSDDYESAVAAFFAQPERDQWARCLPRLHPTLRMGPADWRTYRFGHRLTVLDLLADDWRERLDEAPLPESESVAVER